MGKKTSENSVANRYRRWGYVIAFLVAGVGCISAQAQEGMPAATVRVQAASTLSLAPTVLVPGTVLSRNDANIAAEISGRLTWVAEIGDRISEGEVLARIDDYVLQLRLLDNKATIKSLQANLRYLKGMVDRYEQLASTNSTARNELDQSIAQREMAEQGLIQATVARDQTLYEIDRSNVKAPFSGQVVARMAQAGEFIGVGGAVARLVDTRNIEVRAQAPITVAAFVHDGLKVVVRGNDQHTESQIRSVIAVGDERSRMIEIRITLASDSWPIGSAVRVELPRSKPADVVVVSRDALILREDGIYLFKVDEDNTVERIPVETGIGNDSVIEVRGNVVDGDIVVIRGGERLRSGQPITILRDT